MFDTPIARITQKNISIPILAQNSVVKCHLTNIICACVCVSRVHVQHGVHGL